MKISVIVPVYNAERYLDKLVQSVLSQTYEDYELILVDDSSKDNSYLLMKKYQEMDSRIKAYTKENTGPGLTRKFGFEKSSGDLFFFVDSDDWVTTSDVFREINDLFEKNEKIDVLFFDREDIIGDTKDIIPGFNETREGLHNIEELDEVVRPGLGAKIFRKSILTEDMFYESTIFEDLYTTYIYLDKCNNYFYSSKCYYTIYHDVDSSEMAFKMAASLAFRKGMEEAQPVLLEPIMSLKITIPEEYMGDVMGDINKRRGKILGMEPLGKGKQVIYAQAPQAETFKYAIDLRSMTQGRGYFEMEIEKYDEVPYQIAQKIIAQANNNR